jgi:hypothetical protein
MTVVVLGILFANILWAVLNWKREWDHLLAVWSSPPGRGGWRMAEYALSLVRLVGDVVLTSCATTLFGLGGFYGAAGALFMSNLLSVVFFLPRGHR